MNKQIIGLILIAILLITGTYFWKIKTSPKTTTGNSTSEIVLYFGDTCPHCKILEEFLQANKVAEKVSFTEKEVYKNPTNAKELTDRAIKCGIKTDSIGVPFLWDGEKCYMGGDDVTAFFKQKASI
jgi:glutaredoxin